MAAQQQERTGQEERIDKLRAALYAEPERMARYTDRHAALSALIARLQVKLELGDDVRAQLTAAVEERSDLAVDISLNGRRAQALQAELAAAEQEVAQARAAVESAARARWAPRLRKRLPALELAAMEAMQQLMAARSLVDVIPAGMLDAGQMMKKMAYYEGTGAVERIKEEMMREHGAEPLQEHEQEQAQEQPQQATQPQSQPQPAAPRRERSEPGDFQDGPMPAPEPKQPRKGR